MVKQKSNDKDFIDLIILLWNSRKTIVVFILISFLFSLSAYQFTNVKYQVSIPYEISINSTKFSKLCNQSQNCIMEKTNNNFKKLFKTKIDSVEFTKKNINFFIDENGKENDYLKIFEDVNKIFTGEVYENEVLELNFFKTSYDIDNLFPTLINKVYSLKRNIFLIDKGKNVYEFDKIIINRISHKKKFIIINFITFISCILFILTREIIREKRTN